MTFMQSLTGRVFRTRRPERDSQTDLERIEAVRAVIIDAIAGATRERDGLKQRVSIYYGQASALLDEAADFEDRSSDEEQEIADAERAAEAGLRRIDSIDAQLVRFNSLLSLLD